MQRQIEDLNARQSRVAAIAGEVQELELEACSGPSSQDTSNLCQGEFGGDVVHRVLGPLGQPAHHPWESKRTKTWTDGCFQAPRRPASSQAEIADGQPGPSQGVTPLTSSMFWVTHPRAHAVPSRFATPDRVACDASPVEGQQTKMEMITVSHGARFRLRVSHCRGLLPPCI